MRARCPRSAARGDIAVQGGIQEGIGRWSKRRHWYPLCALIATGHEVVGLVRTPPAREQLARLGTTPLIADVLDRDALLGAAEGLHADAVIHELTALKTLPMRHADLAATDRLRTQGTANLLEAAQAIGARRFVTQSYFGGYGFEDHGGHVLSEEDPFGAPGRGRCEAHLAAMRAQTSRLDQVTSTGSVHFTSALGSGLPQTSPSNPDMLFFQTEASPEHWLAWTGTDRVHHLNVQWMTHFPLWPDPLRTKTILPESSLGGPSLGFGAAS